MKRTFGRFMSLLLVFAMVLAMVPAVFAANEKITSFTGETKYIAPGQSITIDYETEKSKAKTPSNGYSYVQATEIKRWECSKPELFEVTNPTKKEDGKDVTDLTKAVVTHRTGTGSATITAYYTDSNKKDQTAAKWTVTVSDYTLKFTPSTLNTTTSSKPYALSANGYVDLGVEVIGPSGWVSDLVVKFTTEDKTVAYVGSDSTKNSYETGLYMGNSQTTGTATARVHAGTASDIIYIKAELQRPYMEGKEQKYETVIDAKYFYVDVAGSSEYQVKFTNTELTDTNPANRVLTAAYNTPNKTLTPKLYKNGGSTPISSTSAKPITFTYTSSQPNLVRVTNTGEVRLQDSTQQDTGRAQITVTAEYDGVSVSTYCYIDVVKETTSGLTLQLHDDSYAALVTDGKKLCASTTSGQSVSDFTLIPTVTPGNANADKNRIVWKSSDSSIAKVTYSNTTHTAYVQVVGSGSFFITATLDGQTVKYEKFATGVPCYAWEEVKYTRSASVKPNISGPISNTGINDAIDAIARQTIEVKLAGTNATKRLPILRDTVYPVYGSNNDVAFTGYIDGIDEENHVLYCPTTKDTDDKFTTDYVSLSTISIIDQPVDTKYKVGTSGSLTIRARVGQTGDTLKTFQWFNQRNELVYSDDVSSRNLTVTTSTLDLSASGVIDASSSSNSFYCVVTSKNGQTARSYTANVVTQGDYLLKITASSASVTPGGTLTLSGIAQRYDPSVSGSNKWVEVTNISNITWTVDQSSLVTLSKTTSSRGESITVKAKSGGTVKITARATDTSGNVYEGTQQLTITVPTADDVTVMLDDNATYVALDGTKISDAVKSAAKSAPSYISFTQPSNGVIYTTSAMSSKVTDGNRYSPSDVSKMVFKPTSNAASYTLEYKAYGSDGQIASGKVLVMTSAGSVVYHISANESQQMLVNDFQSKYGNGLSSVVFGTNSDNRGGLYKGSTTSSGKVGSESYTTATLKNVYFIAGSTASKYTVTIPYTANGSNGTKYGNLIVYVNDTHSIYSTGASFRSMDIATEIAPENASSNAYATIDSVVGGKLYSAYSSIISNTPLKTSDFGSTKYYFNSSSTGIDSLYVLPIADKTTVDVNYTVYDGSTRTKGTVSFKVIQQTTSQKFTDVNGSTKWAANSVDFMADSKLVNGITTTTFGPNQTMTRAMLVTILYRAAGQPSVAGITNKFTDLKANEYYVDAVLWAANTGVVTGATATKFDPDGKVTREQIAAILYRYAGSPTGNAASLTGFSDQKNVSAYAVPALQWAVGLGIITGVSTNGRTTLSAKNNATRAQVAVMLHRFLTYDR